MIPSPAMSLLVTLLKSRITWGVGIALGVWVALAAHGALRYRDGVRDGTTATEARHATADATSRAIADSAWREIYAQATAARDSVRALEAVAADAAERRAAAESRLRIAIRTQLAQRPDTTPPQIASCDTLAMLADSALAAHASERAALRSVIGTQALTIRRMDSLRVVDVERFRQATARALSASRPTRSRWRPFVVGLGLGAAAVAVAR